MTQRSTRGRSLLPYLLGSVLLAALVASSILWFEMGSPSEYANVEKMLEATEGDGQRVNVVGYLSWQFENHSLGTPGADPRNTVWLEAFGCDGRPTASTEHLKLVLDGLDRSYVRVIATLSKASRGHVGVHGGTLCAIESATELPRSDVEKAEPSGPSASSVHYVRRRRPRPRARGEETRARNRDWSPLRGPRGRRSRRTTARGVPV